MKRNIDLFGVLTDKSQAGAKKPAGKVIPFIVLGVLALLMATAVVLISMEVSAKQVIADALQAQVEEIEQDPAYIEAMSGTGAEQKALALINVNSAIDAYKEGLDTYDPAHIYAVISGLCPDHTQLTGFSCQEKDVTISGIALNNLPPADFAKALNASGEFSAVNYTGFQSQSFVDASKTTTDADGNPVVTTVSGYVFTIVCDISDPAEDAQTEDEQ